MRWVVVGGGLELVCSCTLIPVGLRNRMELENLPSASNHLTVLKRRMSAINLVATSALGVQSIRARVDDPSRPSFYIRPRFMSCIYSLNPLLLCVVAPTRRMPRMDDVDDRELQTHHRHDSPFVVC